MGQKRTQENRGRPAVSANAGSKGRKNPSTCSGIINALEWQQSTKLTKHPESIKKDTKRRDDLRR